MTKSPLPVIDSTEGVPAAAFCRSCGGQCCQRGAGIAHPGDFGPRETLVDVLVSYLETGFWAVDCWEGDVIPEGTLPQIWFVRPAHKNAKGKLVDRSWGGECRLWAPDRGCSLEFRHRPHGCRTLVPTEEVDEHGEHKCTYPTETNGKPDAALAWRDYQAEVERAVGRVQRGASR